MDLNRILSGLWYDLQEKARTLVEPLYRTITLSLASARSNEIHLYRGVMVVTQSISTGAEFKIRFNDITAGDLTVQEGLNRRIVQPFDRFYLTNAAQTGKEITLIIAKSVFDVQLGDQKILDRLKKYEISASDTLLESSDSEETGGSATMTKEKEILIHPDVDLVRCSLRIKFDGRYSGGASAAVAQIYKNGVAEGTSRGLTDTYATYSEDIEGWDNNDTIELWGKWVTGPSIDLKNFRVYGTLAEVDYAPTW